MANLHKRGHRVDVALIGHNGGAMLLGPDVTQRAEAVFLSVHNRQPVSGSCGLLITGTFIEYAERVFTGRINRTGGSSMILLHGCTRAELIRPPTISKRVTA